MMEKVGLKQPDRTEIGMGKIGMREITDTIRAEIVRSGKMEGVCVITVLDDRAAVIQTNRDKPEICKDILDDLEHIFPPRINYRLGEMPVEAAARSKAAVTGSSLEVMIQEGKPALPPEQGIFVADFVGGLELEIAVMCV